MTPVSDEAFNRLIHIMEMFLPLTTCFKRALRGMLYETCYRAGEKILYYREIQKNVWFLLDGTVREIRFHKESSAEYTAWFWQAESFVYVVPGFFGQLPSESIIEVLEDCRLIFISHENWEILRNTFDETNVITEIIRVDYEKQRQEQASDIVSMTAEARYLKHKTKLQKLSLCALQKDIAGFMGMTSDTLGRLRKKY